MAVTARTATTPRAGSRMNMAWQASPRVGFIAPRFFAGCHLDVLAGWFYYKAWGGLDCFGFPLVGQPRLSVKLPPCCASSGIGQSAHPSRFAHGCSLGDLTRRGGFADLLGMAQLLALATDLAGYSTPNRARAGVIRRESPYTGLFAKKSMGFHFASQSLEKQPLPIWRLILDAIGVLELNGVKNRAAIMPDECLGLRWREVLNWRLPFRLLLGWWLFCLWLRIVHPL